MANSKPARVDVGFFWALAMAGAVPFVAFVVVGSWSQVELGVGTLFLLIAGAGLTRECLTR